MRTKLNLFLTLFRFSLEASRRYRRFFPIVWFRVLRLKLVHEFAPWEIKEMGLLEDDLGEFEVMRNLCTRRLNRWLHRVNPNERSSAINIKPFFYATCEEKGIPVP